MLVKKYFCVEFFDSQTKRWARPIMTYDKSEEAEEYIRTHYFNPARKARIIEVFKAESVLKEMDHGTEAEVRAAART